MELKPSKITRWHLAKRGGPGDGKGFQKEGTVYITFLGPKGLAEWYN